MASDRRPFFTVFSIIFAHDCRFKLKLALARFILTTIELLCLFTKILKIKRWRKKQVLIFVIAVKKLMYKKKINAIKRNLLDFRWKSFGTVGIKISSVFLYTSIVYKPPLLWNERRNFVIVFFFFTRTKIFQAWWASC